MQTLQGGLWPHDHPGLPQHLSGGAKPAQNLPRCQPSLGEILVGMGQDWPIDPLPDSRGRHGGGCTVTTARSRYSSIDPTLVIFCTSTGLLGSPGGVMSTDVHIQSPANSREHRDPQHIQLFQAAKVKIAWRATGLVDSLLQTLFVNTAFCAPRRKQWTWKLVCGLQLS